MHKITKKHFDDLSRQGKVCNSAVEPFGALFGDSMIPTKSNLTKAVDYYGPAAVAEAMYHLVPHHRLATWETAEAAAWAQYKSRVGSRETRRAEYADAVISAAVGAFLPE